MTHQPHARRWRSRSFNMTSWHIRHCHSRMTSMPVLVVHDHGRSGKRHRHDMVPSVHSSSQFYTFKSYMYGLRSHYLKPLSLHYSLPTVPPPDARSRVHRQILSLRFSCRGMQRSLWMLSVETCRSGTMMSAGVAESTAATAEASEAEWAVRGQARLQWCSSARQK